MKFNNILVVLNPENDKQYALARAVRLAQEQKSPNPVNITLFLAIYDLSYEMSALLSSEERTEMRHNVIEQRKLAIRPYIEKYASDGIQFSSTVVWHSNEAEAITREVETHNYDLVVKYTKVEESLKSLIVTPVDWQILRKCPTPILVVKDGDWKHQRRILVAVNVSDDENEAHSSFNDELVSLSMDLADSLDRGNIHLVTAYPPTPINMAIDLPEFSTGDGNSGLRGQYLLNMKALRQKYGISDDHTHVLEGFPEDVIPQVAEKLEAELVILGTIGRTGLSAAFLGNTAEHVISKLNCNLLAIKPSKKDN